MHEKEKRNEKSGGSHFPTRYDGAGVMEQIYSTSPLSSSHQKEGKKEGEGVGFLSMASVPVCLARSGMVLLEGAMEARGGGGGGEEEKEEERRKKKKKRGVEGWRMATRVTQRVAGKGVVPPPPSLLLLPLCRSALCSIQVVRREHTVNTFH